MLQVQSFLAYFFRKRSREKIIIISLLCITCIVFAACGPRDLNEYKRRKLAELNDYVENVSSKLDEEFDDSALLDIISDANDEIANATNERQVDEAVDSAKNRVNDNIPISGKFYSLTEAFENGIVEHADLLEMADRVNNNYPISLDALPPNVANALVSDYEGIEEGMTASVETYYGDWHGAYLVVMNLGESEEGTEKTEIEVDGVEFSFEGEAPAVWIESK